MNEIRYPEWPNNQVWPSLEEWKKNITPRLVEMGKGILSSNLGNPEIWPLVVPHPDYVKEWRSERNESVSNTARHFGLTEVQVLHACR